MNSWLIVCLALAALLALNTLASVAAATLWLVLRRRVQTWPVATRARFLFALRLSPSLAALVAVLTLFIPAYLTYEPRPADEVVNLKIAVMAAAATLGITLTGWRSLASWRATRRLVTDWLIRAEKLTIDGLNLPAFRFPHSFPVLAVVGISRPRLFIADCVMEALDEHELAAALAHEAAHLDACDHLKLGLLRACRDVFALLPGRQAIERAWAIEAEAAADEHAARAGKVTALNLAAALIKVARLTPAASKLMLPAGAYLIGEQEGGIERRVQRLLELAERQAIPVNDFVSVNAIAWRWGIRLGWVFLALGLFAILPHTLLAVFLLTEQFFFLLR